MSQLRSCKRVRVRIVNIGIEKNGFEFESSILALRNSNRQYWHLEFKTRIVNSPVCVSGGRGARRDRGICLNGAKRGKFGIPLSQWAVWDARAIAPEVAPKGLKSEMKFENKSPFFFLKALEYGQRPPPTHNHCCSGNPHS